MEVNINNCLLALLPACMHVCLSCRFSFCFYLCILNLKQQCIQEDALHSIIQGGFRILSISPWHMSYCTLHHDFAAFRLIYAVH